MECCRWTEQSKLLDQHTRLAQRHPSVALVDLDGSTCDGCRSLSTFFRIDVWPESKRLHFEQSAKYGCVEVGSASGTRQRDRLVWEEEVKSAESCEADKGIDKTRLCLRYGRDRFAGCSFADPAEQRLWLREYGRETRLVRSLSESD